MFVAREGGGPSGLQPRVHEELRHRRKLERGMGILRMRPYRAVAPRWLGYRISHHVEQPNLPLAQLRAGFRQIINIPGDRVKMLAVARVELAQGGLLPTRRATQRLCRLHHEVTD